MHVAKWILEFAAVKNIDYRLFDISKLELSQLESIDSNALILIISQLHGFNYPKITLDFIRHFPSRKNKVVLMNTRAGMKIGTCQNFLYLL